MVALTTQDERDVAEILKSPCRFGEATIFNKDGSPRHYWPNQRRSMECPARFIIHQDATEVGKTIELAALICHHGATTRGKTCLVAAPLTAHLMEIIDEVEYQLGESELLRSCLLGGNLRTAITKQPYYTIKWAGKSITHFRPAGKEGAAYKSIHVDLVLTDEGAGINRKAWSQLFKRMNPGGVFRVYSYPNGRRDTPYFEHTQKTAEIDEANPDPNCWISGGWVVFHYPMSCRPDWTKEREAEQARELSGRDTPDYQHMVLGIHGTPSYGAFDMEAFYHCFQKIEGYRTVTLTADDFRDDEGHDLKEPAIDQKLRTMFPPLQHAKTVGDVWMGVDTGYTADPAEIRLWRETDLVRCFLRVHMERIPYPIQAKVIAAIDRCYVVRGMGIDAGGNGKGVIQDLQTRKNFADLPDLDERLLSIDFGGSVVIERKPDDTEVKQGTKELMTALLNSAMRRGTAVWPRQDNETEGQYSSHSYVKNDRHIVYSRTNDHIIDADRCAFLVREWHKRLRDIAGGFVEEPIADAVVLSRRI